MSNNNNAKKYVFRFEPLTAGDYEVYVVGDFNGWKKNDDSKMLNNNGIYTKEYSLIPGEYAYKFYVNGKWIKDEKAEKFAPDSFGGENSILVIEETDKTLRRIHLEYPASSGISSAAVTGSFNKWNPKKFEMIKKNGRFQLDFMLYDGKYEFKFLIDGKEYLLNKLKYRTVPDGLGGENHLLVVDSKHPEIIAEKGDSSIETDVLSGINRNILEKISDNLIQFTFRTVRNDVEYVKLNLNNKDYVMHKAYTANNFDVYQIILDAEENIDILVELTDGSKSLYWNGSKFSDTKVAPLKNVLSEIDNPEPKWIKEGIIYQIFPDRFQNGNADLNQDFSEWYYQGMTTPPPKGKKLKPKQKYFRFVKNWYDHALLQHNPLAEDGGPDLNTFYGGDIDGIHQKLDYIDDLGINIIYLNPVNEARSNHKYDVIDFKKIDPHFGDKATFKKFVAAAHRKGIQVILDLVLNHTGDGFHAFQHVIKYGKDSKYFNWYEWRKLPVPYPFPDGFNPEEYYASWWEHADLPDLNYDLAHPIPQENKIENIEDASPNQELVDYMLSVADFWLSEMDIDGFRLDVPNEVPFWFLELFRDKCYSIKPDAVIIGEIWQNAEKWMDNDYFNGIMNYEYFKDPVLDFICNSKISAEEFDNKITHGLDKYRNSQISSMMNLLDSHDTYRILRVSNGIYDKVKLAALFQMTFKGMPHIWYGDEIAMTGGKDPDNRRPFNWKYYRDKKSVEMRNYYKILIALRKDNSEFTLGGFKTILTDKDVYVYSRFLKDKESFVVLNTGNSERTITIDIENAADKYVNLLDGTEFNSENGKLIIKVSPVSGAVLKAAD